MGGPAGVLRNLVSPRPGLQVGLNPAGNLALLNPSLSIPPQAVVSETNAVPDAELELAEAAQLCAMLLSDRVRDARKRRRLREQEKRWG